MKPDLKGTSILITGTSSGFGRLGAEHYARLGAKVFATMRNTPRPEAEDLMKMARDDKLDLTVLEIDVLDEDQIGRAVATAEQLAGGGIDVLVNNAGIGISGPVEVHDIEAIRLAFETNVFGCHRMIRAMLPGMRAKGGGHLFQISSQLGRVIVPGAGHYSATKFALEAMSEQLAYELVPHNIGVTVIQPGGYPTKVWVNRNRYTTEVKARVAQERLDAYPALTPRMGTEDGSGRTADPMDVPHAIVDILGMPAGTRPLRKAVHPGRKPQEPINQVSAEIQVSWLGRSPFGPWINAVHNIG